MEEKVVVKKPPKSPALAGVLSFFFPGIGQIYNRQIYKGFIFILLLAALVTLQEQDEAQPFIAIILGGFYFYQLIDAIQTAKLINQKALKEEVEEKIDELPQLFKTGSVFWGIIILGLGVIFLLANFEVISYGMIWNFWPLVIIIIGGKLIYDYAVKKNGNGS